MDTQFEPVPVSEEVAEKLREHGLPAHTALELAAELCSLLEDVSPREPGHAARLFQTPRLTLLAALSFVQVAAVRYAPERLSVFRGVLADLLLDVLRDTEEVQAPGAFEEAALRRLLVVDDDSAVRESLSEVLAATGYAVDQAASGEEALEYLAAAHYDAILADVALPGIDGWELAQRIRDRDLRAVVLLVSGWRRAPSEEDERMRFVDGFVEKPIDPRSLTTLLGGLLKE
jgi:CheY-like chemotaxis protein